jgi:AcrR family transcriptional regulator
MAGKVKTKTRKPGRRQHKRRAEIIDAAARVFADLGYHAASTQSIADVLGMRQASLYYYFECKEQALHEVCLIGVQGFLEGLEEICASDAPLAEKIRLAIHNHMLPLREKRPYVRVFLRDRHLVTATHRQMTRRVEQRYEALWETLVTEGQDAGLLRATLDPTTVVLGIIGMCNASTVWLDPYAPGEIERVADQFAAMVLSGLLVPQSG